MVIDQADLLARRRATLREIFTFLAVDDTFDSPQFDQHLYRSSERPVYPAAYWRLVEWCVVPAVRRVPADIRRAVRASIERALLPSVRKPTLDDHMRARLEELYAEDVRRLRALTGKEFPTWSI